MHPALNSERIATKESDWQESLLSAQLPQGQSRRTARTQSVASCLLVIGNADTITVNHFPTLPSREQKDADDKC